MTFTTGAGATFSLTATAPATFDEAGYDALVPTLVGKITAMSGVPSRVYNEVTVQYLESGAEDAAKGSYSLGSTTLTVALDGDDAGQALLQAANDSRSTYSVNLNHPVHGAIWARAQVFGQQRTWGDNDTPSTWEVTIRYKVASAETDGVVVIPVGTIPAGALLSPVDGRVLLSPVDGRILLRAA